MPFNHVAGSRAVLVTIVGAKLSVAAFVQRQILPRSDATNGAVCDWKYPNTCSITARHIRRHGQRTGGVSEGSIYLVRWSMLGKEGFLE
jgi:hypothetical protein